MKGVNLRDRVLALALQVIAVLVALLIIAGTVGLAVRIFLIAAGF